MATRYYLDSNCISYCLTPVLPNWTLTGVKAIRNSLLRAINRDQVVVVGSQFHLEEGSRIEEKSRQQWMRFFWDAVGWSLLLPTSQLAVLEAKHGRPLQANEPYEEYKWRQYLRDKTLRFPQLDQLARQVEKS